MPGGDFYEGEDGEDEEMNEYELMEMHMMGLI
jgi:hypothetical protein